MILWYTTETVLTAEKTVFNQNILEPFLKVFAIYTNKYLILRLHLTFARHWHFQTNERKNSRQFIPALFSLWENRSLLYILAVSGGID